MDLNKFSISIFYEIVMVFIAKMEKRVSRTEIRISKTKIVIYC